MITGLYGIATIIFVLNLYELTFKSYGHFTTDMQNKQFRYKRYVDMHLQKAT